MNKQDLDKSQLGSIVIAIDGPAASGKTTTAKNLASALGLTYIDTGAMYRSVTLHALRRGIDVDDANAVADAARQVDIAFKNIGGENHTMLNGEDVSLDIRTPEVTRYVSKIAAYKDVRLAMVTHQIELGGRGGVVAEGRDTTTVVFPDADIKVFLTATVEERAKRRQMDMEALGIETSLQQQIEDINRRDRADSTREHSPLRKADDAFEIDTTNLSIDEQIVRIIDLVRDTLSNR
jgi:cytidylate kinase